MFSTTYLAAATAAFSLITSSSAAFNAASKANVAMYWGAGSGQARLSTYCDEANVDIIPLAFINQFQSTANGLIGADFGNQCWGTPVYSGPGYYGNINTTANYLPVNCPDLQDDIYYCQTQTNKKILLSLGGAPTYDEPAYGLNNVTDGINLANFLWNAYGPYNDTYYKAGGLRPLDRGSSNANTSMTIDIDGFDFDIETNSPDEQLGYVACINTLRSLMTAYKKENPCSKDYIISGAPQCPIPDVHMSTIINEAAFDILWIQFYNNDGYGCSAINYTTQGSQSNFNLATGATNWVTTLAGGASKDAKVYIGLPGGPLGVSNAPQDWLTPAEAQALINAFEGTKNFGGVMLWEATAAAAVDMANYAPQYAFYWDAIKAYLNPYAPTTTVSSSICLSTTSTSSSSLTSSSSSSKITSTSSSTSTQVSSTSSSSSSVISSSSSSSSSSQVLSSSSVLPTSSSSSVSSSSSQVSSTSSSSSSKVSPSSSSSSSSLVSSSSSSSSVVPTSSSSSSSSSLSSSTSSASLSSSVSVATSSSVVSVTPTSSASASSKISSSGTVTLVPLSSSSVIISSSSSSGSVTPTSSSSSVSSSVIPTSSVSGTVTSVTSTSSLVPTSPVSVVSSSSSISTLTPFSNSTSTVGPSSSSKKSKAKCSSVFPSSSSKVRVSPTSSLSSVSSSFVSTSSVSGTVTSLATSSSSTQYTTSTVYTTSVYTITSCAPTVTNCPARVGQITTETIELYTTICPVTETQINGGIPTTTFPSMAPPPTQYTTSTVYATSIYTITSCAPTVTDCPARLGSVTTEVIKLYTTVCPVAEAAATASSTPAGSVKAVAAEVSASSSSILYTTLSSTTTLYKTVLLKVSTATVVALPPTTVVVPYPTGSSTGNVFATGLPSVSLVFNKELTSTAAGVAATTSSITPAATTKFTGAASASRAGMGVMFAIVLGAVALLV